MRKIAVVLVGVLFMLGLVVFPALAQLPGLPGPQEPAVQMEEVEIQLPDYLSWESAQVQGVGYDTDLDGVTDSYSRVYQRKRVIDNMFVDEVIQLTGKFGQEPEIVYWLAVNKASDASQQDTLRFERLIIRKEDGKYYEVSSQAFDARGQEFSESLPKYLASPTS